jgi:electron transfer flavoprotein beta subunit
MKVLVCISQVPDTTTKVRFIDGNKKLDTTGIQWIINPWDELSLTRALELKDDPAAGVKSVTVAHVGPASAEPTIRKCLAIGADDAIRVNAEPTDAFYVAAQLAEVVKSEKFDIILCGIESSDHNESAVGGMLAEILEYPSVSAVSGISVSGGEISVNREIDGGREVVTVPYPFVAVVQKGIAKEPRIAAMRGIMMARSKPIKVVEPVSVEIYTEVSGFELPNPGAACRFIDPEDPKQLISILQNEVKVI